MATKEETDKQILTRLHKIADKFWISRLDKLPETVKGWFEQMDINFPKPEGKHWDKWCDSLKEKGYCDQDTADLLKTVKGETFPLNVLLFIITPIMLVMGNFKSITDIFNFDRQYDAQAATTPHPAPIDNLVRSMMIDPGRSTENRAQLKRLGFDDAQIDNIILSYYKTTDENTVRVQFLRGIIDEAKMYERMRELGYTDARTAEIIQTWKLLPPAQDLFTMVAHEAFEPDIYNKLGLNAEFPEEQLKWLEDQGISEAWARKYWIAHWEQPSILQGFEMLHRGVIDADLLDLLFRTVEIPPYWRDKLTKIAYNPFTRVDVRRMHDLGVIDDEQLIKSYMDLGYDAEKAGKMAEFTVKYNQDTAKGVSRSSILASYHDGLIKRTTAADFLENLGYDEDTADWYLTQEDYNITKEAADIQLENVRDAFLLGLETLASTRSSLNKLNLPGENIEALLDSWQLDKWKYEALPSRGDLDAWLVAGIIDEQKWRYYMSRHGYSHELQGYYLREMQGAIIQGGRLPSKTDLNKWYKKKIISETQWRQGMQALGYSENIINRYRDELG